MTILCDSCVFARYRNERDSIGAYCGRDGRSIKLEADAERCKEQHMFEELPKEWKGVSACQSSTISNASFVTLPTPWLNLDANSEIRVMSFHHPWPTATTD